MLLRGSNTNLVSLKQSLPIDIGSWFVVLNSDHTECGFILPDLQRIPQKNSRLHLEGEVLWLKKEADLVEGKLAEIKLQIAEIKDRLKILSEPSAWP